MGFIMKDNLIPFPTVKKSDRLKERARIVAENFSHPQHGIPLMLFVTHRMYEAFSSSEVDWLEMNILSKLHEVISYMEQYGQGEDIGKD